MSPSILGAAKVKPDSRTPEQKVVAAAQRALRKGKGPAEVLRVMIYANNGRLTFDVLERLFRELYASHRADELAHSVYDGVRDDRSRVIPSTDLLARAVRRAPDEDASQRWGLHVRAQSVTQFVGETSAGKTVFLYNLAYRLAAGKEFLGLTPPRPLRVLHLDFESYDDLIREHLGEIGTVDGWDFWDPDEFQDMEAGPALVDSIEARVVAGRYDVVIVDPLMEAYPCDENDNAAATVQMKAFRRVARGTGAAVVLAHNTGLRTKAPKTRGGRLEMGKNKYLGRGATARVDKADVSINFVVLDDETRYLHVAKSRASDLNDSMILRFSGEFGYALEITPEDQIALDRFVAVEAFMRGGHDPATTGEIVEHLEGLRVPRRTAERVLPRMRKAGCLKPLPGSRGRWTLPKAVAA